MTKIAFGPRAGEYVRKIGKGFGFEGEVPLVKGLKCAAVQGFNLQAGTYIGAEQRQHLEKLIAYVTRPPLANDRLTVGENGDLIYRMKRTFSDGTQAVLLSPSELLERLCAMVPPPRAHQQLYTGVFSSRSKWRSLIVLEPEARKGFSPASIDKKKVKNHRRAKLLKRIFKIDIGLCPHCGAELEIRAAVHDREEIRRYLHHFGVSEHPPPIAPARREHRELELTFHDDPYPQDDIQISPVYP